MRDDWLPKVTRTYTHTRQSSSSSLHEDMCAIVKSPSPTPCP